MPRLRPAPGAPAPATLLAVLLVVLSACTPTDVPSDPDLYAEHCAEVSCGSGVCVVGEEGARCLCDVGFRAEGGSCVRVPPPVDPCAKALCTKPNQGQCTERDGAAQCECDAGFEPAEYGCLPIPPPECLAVTEALGGDALEPDSCASIASSALVEGVPLEHRTLAPAGDADWFRLQVRGGKVYLLEAESADGLALYLDLYDAQGITPLAADHGGGSTVQLVWSAPRDGEVTARLAPLTLNGSGGYTVRWIQLTEDDFVNRAADALPIGTTGVINGRIDYPEDRDVLAVQLVAGSVYRLQLAKTGSSNVPLRLSVLGPDATSTIYSAEGQQVETLLRPQGSGLHTLQIEALVPSEPLPWTVELESLGPDDYPDLPSTAVPLSSPQSGLLERTGDADAFLFEEVAGRAYSLSFRVGSSLRIDRLTTDGIVLSSERDGSTWRAKETRMIVGRVRADFQEGAKSYTLTLTDLGLDDHGDTAEIATDFPTGGALTGVIIPSGEVDAFRVELTAGHVYRVRAASGPSLRLVGPDGTVVGISASQDLTRTAPTSGTYLVYVSMNAVSSSPYTLTVTDVGIDAYGDTEATATPITVGAPASGILEHSADIDMLSFLGTPGTVYRVSATAGGFLSGLRVRHAGKTLVQASSGLNQVVQFLHPSSGPVFIEPGTSSQAGVSWTVEVQEVGPDDHGGPEAATEVTLPVAGMSGELSHPGDVDGFRFEAQAQRLYRVTCSEESTGSCRLTAQASEMTPLSALGELVFKAPAGGPVVVTLEASSSTTLFRYTVSIAEAGSDDHADTAGPAASPLTAGTVPLEGIFETGVDVDVFAITATADSVFRLSCSPGTASCALEVRDAQGTRIVAGSPFTSGDLLAFRAPAAGTYYALAKNRQSSPGTYFLLLENESPDDYGDTPATAAPITLGAAVSGAIQYFKDVDVFALQATEGHIYEARCVSATLPSCRVILKDTSGTVLASGAAFPASWEATRTGPIQIVVYGGADTDTGSYQLTVADRGLDDVGDGVDTASPLTLGVARDGRLETTTDVDAFEVTATAGRVLRLSCTPVAPVTRCLLRIMVAGNLIASGSTPGSTTLGHEIEASGPLHVLVSGVGSVAGGYSLLVEDGGQDDHGDDPLAATSISRGQTISGVLEAHDDIDTFAIQLTAGIPASISRTATSGIDVTVTGPAGHVDYGSPFTPIQSGRHVVKVRTYDTGWTPYTLRVDQ